MYMYRPCQIESTAGNFIINVPIVHPSRANYAYNVRKVLFNGSNAPQERQTWASGHACLERPCSHVDSERAVVFHSFFSSIGSD